MEAVENIDDHFNNAQTCGINIQIVCLKVNTVNSVIGSP